MLNQVKNISGLFKDKSWEIALLGVAVLVFIFNSLASPYFLDLWNLSDATFNFTEKAIIALPMALLIIGRDIDLSVGSIIAICSVAMGLVAQAGGGITLIVLTGMSVGMLAGAVNGFLVTYYAIPSIVVTIGTMSLFRGLSYIILGDGVLKDYPEGFSFFGQGYVVGALSFELVFFLVVALLFYLLLHRTVFGRVVFAIGNNPTAAFYSGVAVNRYRFLLFVLVGLASGIASVMLTSRLGSTRPTIALGWELSIITMVVLGGVNILGGSGSILGVVIAVFLMGLVTFGLGLLNVPGIVMSVVIGMMLIGVISIPVVLKKYHSRVGAK